MNRKFGVSLIAVTLLCGSGAQAQPVTVVTGNDYAPFSDEKLPGGGLATQIVAKALEKGGMAAAVQFAPWKRGYEETLGGKYAATFPYVPTDQRKAEMEYSAPIVEIKQVVYSNAKQPVAFSSVDDLKGKTVCSPVGYALPSAIEELVKQGSVKRESPSDLDNCGKMILAGRADFLVGDAFTAGAMFNRIGGTAQVKASEKALATTYLHLIAGKSQKTTPAVIAAFNAGLKTLKESGEYDRIMATITAGK